MTNNLANAIISNVIEGVRFFKLCFLCNELENDLKYTKLQKFNSKNNKTKRESKICSQFA